MKISIPANSVVAKHILEVHSNRKNATFARVAKDFQCGQGQHDMDYRKLRCKVCGKGMNQILRNAKEYVYTRLRLKNVDNGQNP